MTIIVVVANPASTDCLTKWALKFSEPEDTIEFICLDLKGQSNAVMRSANATISDLELDSPSIKVIRNSSPVGEIVEHVKLTKPRLLLTEPFSFQALGGVKSEKQTSDELVRSVPCNAVLALSTLVEPDSVKKMSMIVNQSGHDLGTLRISERLSRMLDGQLTLTAVEEKNNSRAEIAGEMAIKTLVHDFGMDKDAFETRVAVDHIRHRGIRESIKDQDVLICGLDGYRGIRPLNNTLDGKLVLIVKPKSPIRISAVSEWLPKINPKDHAELLQELRHGSRWNQDFVSMLSLASAIAALGLMQNSPAVVIGSMLLAPLMTPMIGAGLALAQANITLARRCAGTIVFGILLSFTISFLVGILTPSRETLAPEIVSRGSPNLLDLLIAFGAAIAATIAMARPNIAGAIAGVAIATALVPPLCAVGLSVAAGKYTNGFGALLLFATNLFAIVLASSITFSLMGIVSDASVPRYIRIARQVKLLLLVLLAVLTGPLTVFLYSQLEQGRPQPAAYPVTRSVSRALVRRVALDEGVEITFLARSSVTEGVFIQIASDHDLPVSYASELREICRKKMKNKNVPVTVVCLRGQWLSKEDPAVKEPPPDDSDSTPAGNSPIPDK